MAGCFHLTVKKPPWLISLRNEHRYLNFLSVLAYMYIAFEHPLVRYHFVLSCEFQRYLHTLYINFMASVLQQTVIVCSLTRPFLASILLMFVVAVLTAAGYDYSK